MLVSVIIPCYNNESFVAEAIQSALDQSYEYKEVIVIDDGSTDNSAALIRSFGNQIIFLEQKNQGAPIARNLGLNLAKGQFVKFLDADDLLMPDCLALQVDQLKSLGPFSNAVVTGDVILIDEKGRPLERLNFRSKTENESPIDHMLNHNPLTSSPLHPIQFLRAIGGFDESLIKGQEWDLHLRLALKGYHFVHFPIVSYQHRQHESETKISQSWLERHPPMTMYWVHQKHEKLITEKLKSELSPAMKIYFGRKYWRYGRAVLKANFPQEAKRYFDRATQLVGFRAVNGKFPYPQLVRLLGPVPSEKIVRQLKKFSTAHR